MINAQVLGLGGSEGINTASASVEVLCGASASACCASSSLLVEDEEGSCGHLVEERSGRAGAEVDAKAGVGLG